MELTSSLTTLESSGLIRAHMKPKLYYLAWAILVWIHLKQVANEIKQTVYRHKHELLSGHLRQQLKSPAILMNFV